MELKKLPEDFEVEIEKYPDGTMGIILSKQFVHKFDEVFGDQPVNISIALSEKYKKIIIEVEIPKDYIV